MVKKTFVKPTLTTINVLSQANLMSNSGQAVMPSTTVDAYNTAGTGAVLSHGTGFENTNAWSD